MSKADIDAELCRTLGVEKVIWLPGDVNETETDGHADGTAAFVRPGVVLVEINNDESDPHYSVCQENLAAMQGQTDAQGRKIQIELIEEASYHPGEWNGGCGSFIFAYLVNGGVICSRLQLAERLGCARDLATHLPRAGSRTGADQ